MKKLTALLNTYRSLQDEIHENRKSIQAATKKSQKARERLIATKTAMLSEMGQNFKVYEFCMKEFGVIDWRFHTLYYLLFRSVK